MTMRQCDYYCIFVKQKTAYEMRISDWSSDVCSSDLLSTQEREHVKELLGSDEYVNQPPVQVYYRLLQQSIYLCSISTMHRILREAEKIGRDSCRERVCQYV